MGWILGAFGIGGIGAAIAFIPSVLPALVGALIAAWGWATKNPAAALCAVFLATTIWFWHSSVSKGRTIAAQKVQIAQIMHASDANRAAQIAQVKAVEAKSQQIAKDNANVETTLRAELGARSLAYADRMRADKVCVRPAGSPAQDNTAPVDNGPGPDAVVVGRADFDILTGNTARLEAAHQWGEKLISAGLAVPAQ